MLNLAEFLVELRDEKVLRFDKVRRLIYLWEQLSDFYKKRTVLPRRFTKKPWSGKFGGREKHVAPGVESIAKLVSKPLSFLCILFIYSVDFLCITETF